MKAIQIRRFGDASVLELVEMPKPEPGPGEARVKIAFAGVNFIDIYFRTGLYPGPLPAPLGQEGAGVVDAVGPNVTLVKPGDRVAFAAQRGAYTEYAIVPAAKLVPVPEGVEPRQAAAVLLQGITAHYLTRSAFPLQRGQVALVHAAAGGVGLLLNQMAREIGARVIGTVSTEDKARLARQAGAGEVILYTQSDFEVETRRLTGGAGVDVVYDSVGKTTFEKSLNCLKPRGYMILFGQSSGPAPVIDPQTLNAKGSIFLTRPGFGAYTATRAELLERSEAVFSMVARGKLDVHVDRVFPLSDAADAQRYLETRQSKGKVLLSI